MERPRRHVRPPGALNDYLTVDDSEKKSIASDGSSDHLDDSPKEEENNTTPNNESEKLLIAKPYKCGDCKARYRSKVALQRHAVKHSGDKPFTCPECGKGLSSQCALSEHMNIHTNSRPYRCEECGQESRQLSVHLRHLLTHQSQSEHMFSCSVCAKTFKQNEYLRRHMRKHTGEKPFGCEECGKSFTCKSELNRHKKRHSSDRPHVCSDCGQTFKMRHNLRTHIKAHAGTQQWKCLLCSAVFSKPKSLESHRKTHIGSVAHMEVNRPSESSLILPANGDDRRKLPAVHNVILPKDKLESIISTSSPHKKIVRVNDAAIPLEFILKSVGKGNSIEIIDKPSHPKQEAFPSVEKIVKLIEEEGQELQEGTFQQSQHGSVTNVMNDANFVEGDVKTVTYEPVEVASVLSISASIESHCLSNHYLQVNPASEDYRCWLATCASLCEQLDPPFDIEVCKLLHQITMALQFCLIQGPRGSHDESPSERSSNLTSDLVCSDSSEYQFVYEQYVIIMGKLQAHINYLCNANK